MLLVIKLEPLHVDGARKHQVDVMVAGGVAERAGLGRPILPSAGIGHGDGSDHSSRSAVGMGRDGGTARISAGSPYGQVGHAVEIDVIVDCVVPGTDAAEAKPTLAARLGIDRSGDAVVAAGLDGVADALKGKPF